MLAVPVAIVSLTTAIAGLLATGTRSTSVSTARCACSRACPATSQTRDSRGPCAMRNELPGTLALQGELVLSTLLVLTAVTAVLVLVARRLDRVGAAVVTARARWASRGELADLHTARPAGRAYHARRHNGKLIAAEPRASVLGVGPAQSGKSTGLIVPAILEWDGPALSTSIKSDVVHDTHRRARTAR